MGSIDWDAWAEPFWSLGKAQEREPVRVAIRCEYPDQPPTEVRFIADPSLGRTANEVNAAIRGRLSTLEEFELRAVGEKRSLPFSSDTVRSIAVW